MLTVRSAAKKCGTRRQLQTLVEAFTVSVLQILFPPRCCNCGEALAAADHKKLCRPCLEQVKFMHSPLCLACGAGLTSDLCSADRFCSSCLRQKPVFASARSVFHYQGPVKDLLHRLKFQADTRAAAALVYLFGEAKSPYCANDYDLIVPVPLFPGRLKKRGLNQALVLARIFFAEAPEKIEPNALIRMRNTAAQTELSGQQRRKNVRGAFKTKTKAAVSGKRICLVDDVYTTGATVLECAAVLVQDGAAGVDVLTCARA